MWCLWGVKMIMIAKIEGGNVSKYIVVGYYNNFYPIKLGEYDTLEEAKTKRKIAVEVFEIFETVKIFFNGEEVE